MVRKKLKFRKKQFHKANVEVSLTGAQNKAKCPKPKNTHQMSHLQTWRVQLQRKDLIYCINSKQRKSSNMHVIVKLDMQTLLINRSCSSARLAICAACFDKICFVFSLVFYSKEEEEERRRSYDYHPLKKSFKHVNCN